MLPSLPTTTSNVPFPQVLASECCDISYNDLDLIFTVDLPSQKHYERVRNRSEKMEVAWFWLHIVCFR